MVCTDYLTKWVEVKELQFFKDGNMDKFLYEETFTKYGVPREIVTKQGPQFTSELVTKLVEEYEIKHKNLAPYHPQANDQVEVTNIEIESILTKIVQLHIKYWVARLPKAGWAYRTTWKIITSFTPYELVYGKTTILQIELEYKTLRKIVVTPHKWVG